MKFNKYTNKLIDKLVEKIKSDNYKSCKELDGIINDLNNLKNLDNNLYKIDMIVDTVKLLNLKDFDKFIDLQNDEVFNNIDSIEKAKMAQNKIKQFEDLNNIFNDLTYYIQDVIEKEINKKIPDLLKEEFLRHNLKPITNYEKLRKIINESNKDPKYNPIFVEIKANVDNQILNIISNDPKLSILKERYNSILAIKSNPYFRESNISTKTKFDILSKEEIIEMFSPEKFYKLNKNELLDLCQSFANKITSEKGIENPKLCFTNKKPNVGGCYKKFGNYIEINENFLGAFLIVKDKNSNNKYLPYRLMNVIIHECKHCYQINNNSNDKISRYIKNANLISNQLNLMDKYTNDNIFNYNNEILEIDAFNESYEYMYKLSKLNVTNAKDLEIFAYSYLPSTDHNFEPTTFSKAIYLVKSGKLPDEINKSIYEIFKFYDAIEDKYIVYDEKDMIDYSATNKLFVNNLTKEKIEDTKNNEKNITTNLFNFFVESYSHRKHYLNKNLLLSMASLNEEFVNGKKEILSFDKNSTLKI